MTRCVRCGEKPSTPGEADLIETHEMCRRCRHDDLRERVAYLRLELRELAADTDKATAHVLLDDNLEADITALTAPLKEVAA